MIFRTAVYETRTYGGVRGAPHRLQAVRPSTRLTEAGRTIGYKVALLNWACLPSY